MSRVVAFILAIGLIVIAILVFVYPRMMIAPGKLISAHQELQTNCFSCHTPLRGASTERCVTCHKPEEIGRLTTAGQVITKPTASIPFHQKLIAQDCLACHTDHVGVLLLKSTEGFDHTLLKADLLGQCESCHQTPTDSLHQQISGNCRQCHAQDQWMPATFDHSEHFLLDRDHSTQCETCHIGNDYQRYTCYGCHEHTPKNMLREHDEEGIRNFENCVKCHRSADEHEIEDGKNGSREHDDFVFLNFGTPDTRDAVTLLIINFSTLRFHNI